MSIHALSWVLKNSEATLGARLVLLSLADHAEHDGTMAWPSVDTLAKDARLSRRGAQTALRRLEADGMIVATGKTQFGTTIWQIVMDSLPVVAVPDGAQILRTGGAQSATSGGEAAAPNPSLNRPPLSPSVREERAREFDAWMDSHERASGSSSPAEGTAARRALLKTFERLRKDGFSMDDFELASLAVCSDWHRERGVNTAANVLRATKFHEKVMAGRARRARGPRPEDEVSAKYAHLDGVSRGVTA